MKMRDSFKSLANQDGVENKINMYEDKQNRLVFIRMVSKEIENWDEKWNYDWRHHLYNFLNKNIVEIDEVDVDMSDVMGQMMGSIINDKKDEFEHAYNNWNNCCNKYSN